MAHVGYLADLLAEALEWVISGFLAQVRISKNAILTQKKIIWKAQDVPQVSRTMLGKLHDHLDRSDIDGNEEVVLFEGSAIFQKFNVFFPSFLQNRRW